MKFEPVIGLEIHVELKTRTKMFCACSNDPDERHPNINVCPVCLGHPGTLPAINREAVRLLRYVGAALHCELAEFSKFDRKNYFYPDLPKGYQISQYDIPLCKGGYLDIVLGKAHAGSGNDQLPITNDQMVRQAHHPEPSRGTNPKSSTGGGSAFGGKIQNPKKIHIRRIHLEEDTGRLLHAEDKPESLVDFNRAGVPLMELVTEPDLHNGQEVRAFAEELQLILRYLGASGANMEKGEMRVEVNISLREIADQRRQDAEGRGIPRNSASSLQDSATLGTKVEIKNLNSLRSAEKAVDYEVERQTELLEAGKKIVQETRGWHDTKQITFSQREKEEAHDYRYFPEPDLPPLHASREELERIAAEVPELPAARRERFAKEYGIEGKELAVLVTEKEFGDYFEKVASELSAWLEASGAAVSSLGRPHAMKTAINWLLSDFWGLFQEREGSFKELAIIPENFAEFIKLLVRGEINSKAAKEVLLAMYETGQDPSDIVEERGLRQTSDAAVIEAAVAAAMREQPQAVADYRAGKPNALQFLVGKVMAATRGSANPTVVRQLLKERLDK